MPGAPPKAREGHIGATAGRPIVAGVAPFVRPLPLRASNADLWASLEALSVQPQGLNRLEKLHSVKLNTGDRSRYSAFVSQAKHYYALIPQLDPVAKPLLAYYFALNLSKAYLTARKPSCTSSASLTHGVSARRDEKKRYHFQQEKVRIQSSGVFRLLAESTGKRYCYSQGTSLRVVDLLPYLMDAYDLFADASASPPNLLPIADAFVLFGQKQAWIRVEIDRNTLRQRNLGPESVLSRATIFGQQFRLVKTKEETASYETTTPVLYGRKRVEALDQLCTIFDGSLIGTLRYTSPCRHFLVLSGRKQLLSHEAVTFALLHNLSSIVRYRPDCVEKLRGSRHFWLFASWIDRACENFLLAMASRIAREEHRLE